MSAIQKIAVSGKTENVMNLMREFAALKNGIGVIYQGGRGPDGREAIYRIEFKPGPADGRPEPLIEEFVLAPEEKLACGFLSWPNGYRWGTLSPGSEILAYALILDAVGDKSAALRHRLQFAKRFVFTWGTHWAIHAHQVRNWIEQKEFYINGGAHGN